MPSLAEKVKSNGRNSTSLSENGHVALESQKKSLEIHRLLVPSYIEFLNKFFRKADLYSPISHWQEPEKFVPVKKDFISYELPLPEILLPVLVMSINDWGAKDKSRGNAYISGIMDCQTADYLQDEDSIIGIIDGALIAVPFSLVPPSPELLRKILHSVTERIPIYAKKLQEEIGSAQEKLTVLGFSTSQIMSNGHRPI